MVWFNFLPWRFVVKHIAHRHGYLDPLALADRLIQFSQPSEVDIPLELMRAGAVFHARGLLNSRVIQHNLDWVWPYWAEQQFDPSSDSFVPRAFSITHVNLTHRNWTAIGRPDCPELPIVDPCGLLTPFWDRWSLDAWILTDDGFCMIPQRAKNIDQRLDVSSMQVITEIRSGGSSLSSTAWVDDDSADNQLGLCHWRLQAQSDREAWLVLNLRPQNPEGVSFVHKVDLIDNGKAWKIEDEHTVQFNEAVERHHVSDYKMGDVHIHLRDREQQQSGECEVGMVTAAAMFKLQPHQPRDVSVAIDLIGEPNSQKTFPKWQEALGGHCRLHCPDSHYQFLYDAAIRSLILLSPNDVFPGPYTYKRFWFRDAAFIIYGLLCAGLTERARRALAQFLPRQERSGYFCSQEGEWDSNGQVLWIVQQLTTLTGMSLEQNFPQNSQKWLQAIQRGADWIVGKRLTNEKELPHAGLLPAGFSAEHLGPNDYYYWDDFWGIAGLRAASSLLASNNSKQSQHFLQQAENFAQAVDKSILSCAERLGRSAMPASPYRRMDAGAIGSITADYPLRLYPPNDSRMMDTIEFLLENCFIKGAFFQDMIHSGLNAYLTLQVAQVLLRAGDKRYLELMDAVANIASPTGQWPEAIHPHTLGGCMGDGHHTWASTEWVLMVRHCFIREEGGELILCSGIPRRWLQQGNEISFGPAPTEYGPISLTLEVKSSDQIKVSWQASWFDQSPSIHVALPGFQAAICLSENESVVVERVQS